MHPSTASSPAQRRGLLGSCLVVVACLFIGANPPIVTPVAAVIAAPLEDVASPGALDQQTRAVGARAGVVVEAGKAVGWTTSLDAPFTTLVHTPIGAIAPDGPPPLRGPPAR